MKEDNKIIKTGWWPLNEDFPEPFDTVEIAKDWSDSGKVQKIRITIEVLD